MEAQVIHTSTVKAIEGKITFPEVVKQLMQIGIERYHADLVRMEKVFYKHDGQTYLERLPVSDMPEVSPSFDAALVQAAIVSIQKQEIHYPEFLRRVKRAGASAYDVFLDGRQAIYYGRKGEMHVEKFPG